MCEKFMVGKGAFAVIVRTSGWRWTVTAAYLADCNNLSVFAFGAKSTAYYSFISLHCSVYSFYSLFNASQSHFLVFTRTSSERSPKHDV